MLYKQSDLARAADDQHARAPKRLTHSKDTASDFGRIIHSMSFRRLQGKMQLFPPSQSPLLRNRLTHSLEVADIATRIVEHLNQHFIKEKANKIDGYIVTAAALAHDLGHPPFGHTGEKVLARLMHNHGSFEGNAQTLRILTRLENRFVEFSTEQPDDVFRRPYGLNLLHRTIAAIIKYDRLIPASNENKYDSNQPIDKGYYSDDAIIVDKVKVSVLGGSPGGGKLRTIECQIMDLADDIAYSTYDLEDCMISGFVHPLDLISVSVEAATEIAKRTSSTLKKHGYDYTLKPREVTLVFEKLFHGIIRMNETSGYQLDSELDKAAYLGWNYQNSIDIARNHLRRRRMTETLIKKAVSAISLANWNAEFPALTELKIDPQYLLFIEILKHYNYIHTILSRGLQLYSKQAEAIIKTIFRTIQADESGRLLPEGWQHYFRRVDKDDISGRMRVICDYISSLTDAEAINVHSQISSPTVLPDFSRH